MSYKDHETKPYPPSSHKRHGNSLQPRSGSMPLGKMLSIIGAIMGIIGLFFTTGKSWGLAEAADIQAQKTAAKLNENIEPRINALEQILAAQAVTNANTNETLSDIKETLKEIAKDLKTR